MKIKLLIFAIVCFLGCNSSPEQAKKEVDESNHQPLSSASMLKNLVLSKGNVDAYQKLRIAYLDIEFPEEILFYAMIMANKYDYPLAYFDVYQSIVKAFRNDIEAIDEKSASLAIDYLLKASEKKHEQAQDFVEKYSVSNEILDKRALIIKIERRE